ncbi:laccase domain-containing protein [Patescibacteria group bacterium]|nr:laccase domain-containing protein [Patescibacteria group bacterium]
MNNEVEEKAIAVSAEKKMKILENKFELFLMGKRSGDFFLGRESFCDKIEVLGKILNLTDIFVPELDFMRRTVRVPFDRRENGKQVNARTLENADGLIVFFDEAKKNGFQLNKIALSATNADCPFIIGFDSEKNALFSLHSGLKCLHKTGEKENQTVFKKLIEEFGLNPKNLKIFVTAGIQKCCYGRNDEVFPDVFAEWGDEFRSIATNGSRAGQTSLDLSGLIEFDLHRCGVAKENIIVDKTCTCCDGKYWSNVNGDKQRNLIVVRKISD